MQKEAECGESIKKLEKTRKEREKERQKAKERKMNKRTYVEADYFQAEYGMRDFCVAGEHRRCV